MMGLISRTRSSARTQAPAICSQASLRGSRARAGGEAHHFVEPAAAHGGGFVSGKAVDDDVGGARIITRHEVPRIGAIARGAGRSVRRITAGMSANLANMNSTTVPASSSVPSKPEEREVAGEERAQIHVADVARCGAAHFQILREQAAVAAVGFLVDCLGQPGIADQVLEREELAGEIDGTTGFLFLHAGGMRASAESARGSTQKLKL